MKCGTHSIWWSHDAVEWSFVARRFFKLWHGSKAGYSSGVAGDDARRATPSDPTRPRWGLAGCCQLDPSHPTIVTCEVGREGRHAPRPNDVGGPTTFPRRQKGGDPAAAGDLRLGHRAPGRGGRRASIPLPALTTLLSALVAFCLWEFRVFSTNLNILRSICSDHGDPARRGSDGGPRRFTAVVPTPHASSGQWPVKTKRARARSCASVVTRKRPSLNRAKIGHPISPRVSAWLA